MTLPAPPLVLLHVDAERGWRGGERQVLWLAEALRRAGHRSVIAARPGEPLAVRAAASGLDVVPCAPFAEVDPRAVLALRGTIRRHGVHVVHAHTAHAVALAALATLRSSACMVVTRRVDFRLRDNAGTRWKYGRAHAIIAISEAVARALAASGVDRSRVTVVPDGVDLARRIVPATPDTLAALGVSRGAPLVVMVAALVGHKDPVTFVRAIAAARRDAPMLQALLVGEGPLREAVEAEVASLGLAGSLHLAGYRTDADALLAAADVATLSSREEGMGSVLIDALSLGKPVAATAAGGIPEVITDGVTGLLAPVRDPERLGALIVRLLTDAALAARIGAAARRRATDFSIDRTVAGTLSVYERVLGSAARVRPRSV